MSAARKREPGDLALFGGVPLFAEPRHVGQVYLPEWERFREAFQGIFDRRHFTNHGPLVAELEARLAAALGVGHVICMANGTLSLMVAVRALGLTGEVIVPSFTFVATVQALTWAGLEPVFCDVDPVTHTLAAEGVAPLLTPRTSGILGVHLWGRPCDISALTALARERGIALLFDAAHAAGCSFQGKPAGGFGDVEIFSMHATKVLSAAEGGFATTNNAALADRIRTIRNFHQSNTHAAVSLRINAKMSEAQAAMGLLSLEELAVHCARNKALYDRYQERLTSLPGLSLVTFDGREANNHQYLIVDVDPREAGLSRDDLIRLLHAENILARRYFCPGVHRMPPYSEWYPCYRDRLPVTDALSQRLLQLPLGQTVSEEDAANIADVISFALSHATRIRNLAQGNDPGGRAGREAG